MRVPVTSVQSKEMLAYQKKIKGATNSKTSVIFIKKKNAEEILTSLSFSIEDVKIYNCSRIDNKKLILLHL